MVSGENMRQHFIEHAVDVGRSADVCFNRDGHPPHGLNLFHNFLGPRAIGVVVHDDVCPGAGKRDRDAAANPFAGSCHKRFLSG